VFEVGNVFSMDGTARKEELMVAAVLWGQTSSLWNKPSGAALLFELKEALSGLARQFHVDKVELRNVKSVPQFAHPFQSADVFVRGQSIGQITTLHPLWLDEYKLKGPVAFFEVKATPFVQLKAKHPAIKKLSPFPLVQRDFTFTVAQDFASEKITQTIKKAVQDYLFDVEVVDRFQGGSLTANEHSLTYRVTLQNSKQTFTDDELKSIQKTIFDKVTGEFGLKA
jgi:phenylalanyl-tRNA synthetase beta chain